MCVGHVSGQGVTPDAERAPGIAELPCRGCAGAARGVRHVVGLAGRATY